MTISCRAAVPASDRQVAWDVFSVPERRAGLAHPLVSLAVSDPVARRIAGIFASATGSGQVMARFHRRGRVDSEELIGGARVERGCASPEGHAARYCLIGWARGRRAGQVVGAGR